MHKFENRLDITELCREHVQYLTINNQININTFLKRYIEHETKTNL